MTSKQKLIILPDGKRIVIPHPKDHATASPLDAMYWACRAVDFAFTHLRQRQP